jgi:hypothetical protein
LEALKEAITQEVAAIMPKMTPRVMENYWERLNQCIDNEGRRVSDIIVENALCVLFLIQTFFCILLTLVFILASIIGEFFLPHPVERSQI